MPEIARQQGRWPGLAYHHLEPGLSWTVLIHFSSSMTRAGATHWFHTSRSRCGYSLVWHLHASILEWQPSCSIKLTARGHRVAMRLMTILRKGHSKSLQSSSLVRSIVSDLRGSQRDAGDRGQT